MHKNLLAGLVRGATGIPAPVFDINFDPSNQSGIARTSLTRAATEYVVNNTGVLATVASGQLAYDYDPNLVLQGVAVAPNSTQNILLRNNALTTAPMSLAGASATKNLTGPDGQANSAWTLSPTADNARLFQTVTLAANTQYCMYAYVKPLGSNLAVNLYNNESPQCLFLLQGDGYFRPDLPGTHANLTAGIRKVGNQGWYLIWISTQRTATNPVFMLAINTITAVTRNFTTTGTNGNGDLGVFMPGMNLGFMPGPIVATGAAAASATADVLKITDLTGVNASQGTLVIDHDAASGILIKSNNGANTVLTAPTIPFTEPALRSTAISWSGSDSSIVDNGSVTTASGGAFPTIDTDLTLLGDGTAGNENINHVRRVRYYASRLTNAQMQTLTTLPTKTGGTAGQLRLVAHRNVCAQRPPQVITATTPSFISRFRYVVASGAINSITMSFMNWYFPQGGSSDSNTGNAVIIDDASLEYSGATVPVTFSASRGITLADGDNDIQADAIATTSLTGSPASLPVGTVLWVKVRGHLGASGQQIPVERYGAEITGTQAYSYDASTATITSTDVAGQYSFTSGSGTAITHGFSPVMLGKFVTGDPATFIGIGDSITVGTQGAASVSGGYPQYACSDDGTGDTNPYAYLQVAVDGGAQAQMAAATKWKTYASYARVLIDFLGINGISSGTLNTADALIQDWQAARAGSIDTIVRPHLFPKVLSSNSFIDEGGQTWTALMVAADWTNFNNFLYQAYTSRKVHVWMPSTTVLGAVDHTVWVANGTTNYATNDGLHASGPLGSPPGSGILIAAAELRAILHTVEATLPQP